MTVVYPVIYTRTGDEKDTYLVSIPDIDGATEGYGLDDAVAMAKDYITNMLLEKREIPIASNIDAIDPASSCFAGAGLESFADLVGVEFEGNKYYVSNGAKRLDVA